MVATDAAGQLGGLATLWDPWWVHKRAFSCFSGILLVGCIRDFLGHIHILNIYASYKDHLMF